MDIKKLNKLIKKEVQKQLSIYGVSNRLEEAINYTRCCTELICDVCKGKGGIVIGRFMTCPKCKGVGKN